MKDINKLKKIFESPGTDYRPMPFCLLDGDISDREATGEMLANLKKNGFGGIGLQPDKTTIPKYGTDEYYTAVSRLAEDAKAMGLRVIFCDDTELISGSGNGSFKLEHPELISKMLKVYEYSCDANEPVHRKIKQDGENMSIVAYEVDTHEVIDLRAHASDEFVDWNPPDGNWNIMQFVCTDDDTSDHVNYLSYEASHCYVMKSYKRFTDEFHDSADEVVDMTFFRNIHYTTPNRRMWDSTFNKVFIELFDFDPAPFYPALYLDIGEKTANMRAMFMHCRAFMLDHGFFKAVADFTKSHGLRSAGYTAALKTINSPWLFGDGMQHQRLAGAVGCEMPHAYAFGLNGLKLASSAAYNYDKTLVVCDIFDDYTQLDADIIYREALNAYSRGVNMLMPRTYSYGKRGHIDYKKSIEHDPLDYREVMDEFTEFASRAQAMLRGGRHVCDIAMLYPIYSLEAQTTLYEMKSDSFEYPMTPTNADYMNVVNTLMNYCGRDVTILHPDTLNKRCTVEDGELFLCNDKNYERYKLLILPAASMMSVRNLRMVKKLFDGGGKIIATGALPDKAFEYGEDAVSESLGESRSTEYPESPSTPSIHPLTPDDELGELIRHIFGVTSGEVNSFREYYQNENENGGKAYFLPPSMSAVDGTEMPDTHLLCRVLDDLGIAFDVVCESFPKIGTSGILNLSLPVHKAIGVHRKLRSGGIFNYIHRRNAGCDIYYFANSTNTDYSGKISLRGKFTVEVWDPHTGNIVKPEFEYTTIKGETYTSIMTEIGSVKSLFFVCRDVRHNQQ